MLGQKATVGDTIVITPRLCRGARGMLGWLQTDLAGYSGVSPATIRAYEAEARPVSNGTLVLLERAFSAHGIEFIPGGVVLRELEAA